MSILDYLKNLLMTGEGSDFSIFVDADGSKIEKKVHKIIIRRCPYFAAMLDLDGKEAKNGSVTIEQVSSDILEYVLQHIYTEELPSISLDQAIQIATAADYLQLAALKELAIDRWKKQFIMLKDSNQVRIAFRQLSSSPLRVSPDPSWRDVMKVIIYYAILGVTADIEKIAEEPVSVMQFIVGYYGKKLPFYTAEMLCHWVIAKGITLTSEEQQERKQLAAELIRQVDLISLSLRTLAKISKRGVFPVDYMLQLIQEKAELPERAVWGQVSYNLEFKSNCIVELEHETGFLLYWFASFKLPGSPESSFPEKHKSYKPNECKATGSKLKERTMTITLTREFTKAEDQKEYDKEFHQYSIQYEEE